MSFVIGTALAFWLLDAPWRYLVIAGLAAWEGFEIWLFLRWRKVRSITGWEALEGTKGKALSALRPTGQVRVRGQIWTADSSEDVEEGDEIVVQGADGLRLKVAPARTGSSGGGSSDHEELGG